MTEQPPRKRKRIALSAGAGILAFLILALCLLCFEQVQQALLGEILSRALGVTVNVSGVRLGNPVAIGRVELSDVPENPDEYPFASIGQIAVGHSWNPFDPRPLGSVKVDSLDVRLLGGMFTNYDVLRQPRASSAGSSRRNMLPREVTLDEFRFTYARRRGQLDLEGLGAQLTLDSKDSLAAKVTGEYVNLDWITADGEPDHFQGRVELEADYKGGNLSARGSIDVPEVVRLPIQLELANTGNKVFSFQSNDAELHRTFWPPLLSEYAGLRFDFARINVPVASLRGSVFPSVMLDNGLVEAALEGLSVGEGPEQSPAVDGGIKFQAGRAAEDLSFSLQAALPELLMLDAKGRVGSDAARPLHLEIAQVEMHNLALADRVLRYSPIPLRVEHFSGRDMLIQGTVGAGQLQLNADALHIETRGLVVGDRSNPYFSGDLALAGKGSFGSQTAFTGTARLQRGDPVELEMIKDGGSTVVHAIVPAWSRDTLAANVPPRFAAVLSALPGLLALQGSIQATFSPAVYTLEADLSPGLNGIDEAVSFSIHGQGELAPPPAAFFSGEAQLKASGGELSAKVQLAGGEDYALDATLRKAPLSKWAGIVLDGGLSQGLDAKANGGAKIERTVEGYSIVLDLDLPGTRFGEIVLPAEDTLQLRGDIHVASDLQDAQGASLSLEIGDKFQWRNTQWKAKLRPFSALSKTAGKADLAYLGALAGFPDLYGEAAWEGALNILEGPVFQFDLKGRSESLVYGEWSLPYRSTLSIDGPVAYDPAKKALQATNLNARLGEANSLRAASLGLNWAGGESGARIEGTELNIQSDLAPAVTLGFLGKAESAHATLDMRSLLWTRDEVALPMKLAFDAAVLALPNQVARLDGAELAGEFLYQSGFSGSGNLKARRLTAGGASLADINTSVRGDGTDLVLENIAGAIFGGRVSGTVRIGIAREAPAVELALELHAIDLDRFTQEFKPPGVILTGIASGTASLVFTKDGIQDFAAKLESHENFSLNRDMVEYALLSQYIGDVSGGKQIDQVVQDVIGQKAQRAFDSAVLDLGFRDGEIVGVVPLESKKLKLTIDVTADPRVLVDAMQIRQEQAAGSPPAAPAE